MEERVVIEQARSGNRKALERLLTEAYPLVYGYLLKMSRDEELSKDITQEVMVKAIVNIERFRGDSKFSTWLVSMAVNLYKDSGKRQYVDLPLEQATESAEAVAVKNEATVELKGAIAALPDKQKQVFLLKHFQGLSYEEMAKVLKCPIGTVRSRLHHSILNIRDTLERGNKHGAKNM